MDILTFTNQVLVFWITGNNTDNSKYLPYDQFFWNDQSPGKSLLLFLERRKR